MRFLAVVALVACASSSPSVPAVRFANAPIVDLVNDRKDVPTTPKTRDFMPLVYHYDGFVQRRLTRAMELHRARRAEGVNALDEVPDSTWFTNRIGVRDLSPDEVETGPLTADSPELHRPWKIKSSKAGGTSLGFVIEDARGIKYLLKFDTKGNPEIETGTHVVVNRLLWACGYNVPEDRIVYFTRGDLELAKDAKKKDADGNDIGALDTATIDRELATIDVGKDGRIRGLASRWIDGKTIGGHPAEGVRDDDPNDKIPHELRRDLRGAYPIFAWLDHVDVQEGNFVDTWVEDAGDANRHYVRHYLIDFGKSLGAMAYFEHDLRRGHHVLFDVRNILVNLFTLGLIDESWRHRPRTPPPNLGLYDAESFEPGDWHSDGMAYVPFLTADDHDKYWGAKIISRFSRAQLRAAVDAAHFTDGKTVDYLVDTLIARQRKTATHWFTHVAPLEHFEVSRDELCFDDLAVAGGYANGRHYAVRGFDWSGHQIGQPIEVTSGAGHTCIRNVPLAGKLDDGGYSILDITGEAGEIYVHVAREPNHGDPRVIGVWRP